MRNVASLLANTTGEIKVLDQILQALLQAFVEMGQKIAQAMPSVTIAGIILFVGLVISNVLRKVLTSLFTRINLNDFLEHVGITPIFTRIGLRRGPEEFFPKLLYWLIVLLVVRVAADAGQFEEVSLIIDQVISFLPNVLTASVILLVGFLVSDTIRSAVYAALERMGLDYANVLSKILFGFFFILVFTVALSQLGIETELLNASVKIILGGLSAALAIALGLGLKGLAGEIVAGIYVRDLYEVGTEIEYEGENIKVAGVGPVTTKLNRKDGGFIIIPNSDLITKPRRGSS